MITQLHKKILTFGASNLYQLLTIYRPSTESRDKKALLLQHLSWNSAMQALTSWDMEGDKDWASLLSQRSGGKSGAEWRLWVSSSQSYCHLLTIRAFLGPRKLLSGQKWFPLLYSAHRNRNKPSCIFLVLGTRRKKTGWALRNAWIQKTLLPSGWAGLRMSGRKKRGCYVRRMELGEQGVGEKYVSKGRTKRACTIGFSSVVLLQWRWLLLSSRPAL